MSNIRTLPNGELYRVDGPSQRTSTDSAPILSGVAGQHQCPKCGLQCTSPGALQTHMMNDHRPVLAPVEMPDGTIIPAELLEDELRKEKNKSNELEAKLAALTSRLETLEAAGSKEKPAKKEKK